MFFFSNVVDNDELVIEKRKDCSCSKCCIIFVFKYKNVGSLLKPLFCRQSYQNPWMLSIINKEAAKADPD